MTIHTPRKHTLRKTERLKSRTQINELFDSGSNHFLFPLKVLYKKQPFHSECNSNLLFGVTVPKRLHKSAVTRNLIKRRIREAYRINKSPLLEAAQQQNNLLTMMFIYVGKDIESYATIERSMLKLLQKLK